MSSSTKLNPSFKKWTICEVTVCVVLFSRLYHMVGYFPKCKVRIYYLELSGLAPNYLVQIFNICDNQFNNLRGNNTNLTLKKSQKLTS